MIRTTLLLMFASVAPPWSQAFEAIPRGDENSKKGHAQLVEKARSGRIDLYFLGDSITRRWGCTDAAYADLLENWRSHFYGWNAANFGWGGDTTHNVLWRVQNGELDGARPKVIVLQCGTNDIGSASYDAAAASVKARQVAEGIDAILAVCGEKAPEATVLLTGVFPRSDNPGVGGLIDDINRRLSEVAARRGARFIDVNPRLTDTEGKLLDGMAHDGLHLTAKGYDVWAAALKPHLEELLGPRQKVDLAPPPTGDPSATR